jgi:hypothetical protein
MNLCNLSLFLDEIRQALKAHLMRTYKCLQSTDSSERNVEIHQILYAKKSITFFIQILKAVFHHREMR